ncbi:HAMP domain-containing sensor histidine kinase [Deltaproteobacteria bacterium IMCC39524]|nr:HAMP domain-containing sensor histidine kinase [Deltaproteobacteria bacterium IMCC39524]
MMSTNDLILECIRAFVLIALLLILFYRGKLTSLAGHPGWKQILIGFTLITFATILDITDEIPGLERFVIIGDTIIEAFLEKLPGYLLGFIMVLVGFYKMIPSLLKAQEAEKELAEHREHLEQLVKNRTQELEGAQAELLQQERLATLGQLTATVSHELRNPLGTIQSALFSIEESLESKDRQRVTRPIELAERSINRCVKIIEELTSYARVKKLSLSKASVDLWLNNVIEEQQIPETIIVERDMGVNLQAQFDQDKLRQAIVNLISNAIHALESKTSDQKVMSISLKPLQDMYEIQIKDNGIGMPEEVKERIFNPLFSTKDFGIGLGMVIVSNLVKQHRGKVYVESQQGEGTTITLRLPVTIDGHDCEDAPPCTDLRPGKSLASAGKRTDDFL